MTYATGCAIHDGISSSPETVKILENGEILEYICNFPVFVN